MKSKIQKKKQRVLEDSDQSSDDDLPKVGGLKGLGNIKFDADNMGNFDPLSSLVEVLTLTMIQK